MEITGSTVLVTGANRGLGAAFVRGLLADGAKKVYATARSEFTPEAQNVVPVVLDVTDPAQVKAVAARLTDVDIVINNAGVAHLAQALDENLPELLRTDFETNVVGVANVARAFAPVLAANGGGALVNMLSVVSWRTFPVFAAYGPSKSAAWHLTNSLRLALRPNGTLVTGVHVGLIDTDMAAELGGPKNKAEDVAAAVLQGIRNGDEEVLVDDAARGVKAGLSAPIGQQYPVE